MLNINKVWSWDDRLKGWFSSLFSSHISGISLLVIFLNIADLCWMKQNGFDFEQEKKSSNAQSVLSGLWGVITCPNTRKRIKSKKFLRRRVSPVSTLKDWKKCSLSILLLWCLNLNSMICFSIFEYGIFHDHNVRWVLHTIMGNCIHDLWWDR